MLATIDDFLKWIGVAGFVLAALSLGWQIWSYYSQFKERATASIWLMTRQANTNLEVSVVNTGRIPLFLKSVALVILPKPTKQTDNSVSGVTFTRDELPLIPITPEESGPLEAGRERVFTLPNQIAANLHGFRGSMGDAVLEVKTARSLLVRLTGLAVRSAVESVMTANEPKQPVPM